VTTRKLQQLHRLLQEVLQEARKKLSRQPDAPLGLSSCQVHDVALKDAQGRTWTADILIAMDSVTVEMHTKSRWTR
jgi:sugar (pentulose or hexulose) kinase